MTDSKHTPGPWEFDPGDQTIIGSNESIAIASIERMDAGGNKDFHFGSESMSNARLIATSPELLEALQMIVELNPQLPMGAIEQCVSAITKATGN